MTAKEAIKYIIRHCNPDYPKGKTEWETAINMAISALQAQEEPKSPASGSVTCMFAKKMHDRPTDRLISRQEAIDALCRRCDLVADDDEPCTDKCNDIKILEKIPSAQPETARTFVELVVEYLDPEICIYKEYKGKPYYSIKYIENGETHVGYGTYKPEVLSQFLKEYFISSAQPEIVRCGQCKYAEVADAQDNQDGYTCQFHRGSIWFSGSYCSWGKERTDGRD